MTSDASNAQLASLLTQVNKEDLIASVARQDHNNDQPSNNSINKYNNIINSSSNGKANSQAVSRSSQASTTLPSSHQPFPFAGFRSRHKWGLPICGCCKSTRGVNSNYKNNVGGTEKADNAYNNSVRFHENINSCNSSKKSDRRNKREKNTDGGNNQNRTKTALRNGSSLMSNVITGPFLAPQTGKNINKKTLVLDLDETLVHSSFRSSPIAAFVVQVEIETNVHDIFVCKRPGVNEFLETMDKYYEVVIFTASLAKYADPLMDLLDPHGHCSARLFRESCTLINGCYVKDLGKLGRDLRNVIIIDNSPNSYGLQPDNAIPIKSWFDDMTDCELMDLIPILEALSKIDDIPAVMRQTLACESDDEDSI